MGKGFLDQFTRIIRETAGADRIAQLDMLLESGSAHLTGFRAAARKGLLGKIRSIGARDFPQAEAWNRAAAGGAITTEAEELAHFTLRSGLAIGIIGAPASMPREQIEAGLKQQFRKPKLLRLDIGRHDGEPSRFHDLARGRDPGTRRYLGIEISGWSSTLLVENRNGFGWRSAESIDVHAARVPLEMRTLEDFLGKGAGRIIEDGDLGPKEYEIIGKSVEDLHAAATDIASRPDVRPGPVRGIGILELAAPEGADLRLFAMKNTHITHCDLVVLNASDLSLVGGVASGMPYTVPELRGRGYGALYHEVNQRDHLGLLNSGYYSRSGYQTRCAAHRKAVLRAVEEGRPVLQANLNRYLPETETTVPCL